MANMGKIAHCTCSNRGQDRLYGKGQRLHNFCAKQSKALHSDKYRCTVCGRVS